MVDCSNVVLDNFTHLVLSKNIEKKSMFSSRKVNLRDQKIAAWKFPKMDGLMNMNEMNGLSWWGYKNLIKTVKMICKKGYNSTQVALLLLFLISFALLFSFFSPLDL